MNQLDVLVQGIVDSIPKDHVFDTHMVIQKLLQKHTDDYLVNARPFSTVQSYHGHIGKIIGSLRGVLVNDLEKSYSKNIKDDFSACEAWRKL